MAKTRSAIENDNLDDVGKIKSREFVDTLFIIIGTLTLKLLSIPGSGGYIFFSLENVFISSIPVYIGNSIRVNLLW